MPGLCTTPSSVLSEQPDMAALLDEQLALLQVEHSIDCSHRIRAEEILVSLRWLPQDSLWSANVALAHTISALAWHNSRHTLRSFPAITEAIRHSKRTDLVDAQGSVLHTIGAFLTRIGGLSLAQHFFEKALKLDGLSINHRMRTETCLAKNLQAQGALEESRRRFDGLIALEQAHLDELSGCNRAAMQLSAASCYQQCGLLDVSAVALQRAGAVLRKAPNTYYEHWRVVLLAWLHQRCGNPDDARPLAIEILMDETAREARLRSNCVRLLGEIALSSGEAGQLRDALDWGEQSLEQIRGRFWLEELKLLSMLVRLYEASNDSSGVASRRQLYLALDKKMTEAIEHTRLEREQLLLSILQNDIQRGIMQARYTELIETNDTLQQSIRLTRKTLKSTAHKLQNHLTTADLIAQQVSIDPSVLIDDPHQLRRVVAKMFSIIEEWGEIERSAEPGSPDGAGGPC